jgi:serine/threonine protein kinase
LIPTLDEGSFGEVYEAQDLCTKPIVAVKEMKRTVLDARELESCNREVEILESVDHPAVLKLCGFVPVGNPDGDPPSIITEFVSRGSLEDLIRAEKSGTYPSEWDLTQKYIVPSGIAVGMMHLHDHKIIHSEFGRHEKKAPSDRI